MNAADKISSAPLVSIIIRTRNRPEMLQAALQSVTEQDYPAIELVVINDGGTNIQDVVCHFQRKGREIQLNQLPENLGRSKAANFGLQLANGEFIGFLDDDDSLKPSHVGNLVQILMTTELGVAYSGTRVEQISPQGKAHLIKTYNTPYDGMRLLFENYLPIHSVLFHRKYLQQGIQFDPAFDFFEDWDFWLQLSQQTDFVQTTEVTAVYRLHSLASGVHDANKKSSAYLKIYKKWLGKSPLDEIYELLEKSHYWFDQEIAALQDNNTTLLNRIGEKHSHALRTLQTRDHQLTQCNEKLEALGKEHTHAQNIVRERDAKVEKQNKRLRELDRIESSRLWPLCRKLLK